MQASSAIEQTTKASESAGMTVAEREVIETAGSHVSTAFNVLHWAISFNATGDNLQSRVAAVLEEIRAAERELLAIAKAEGR